MGNFKFVMPVLLICFTSYPVDQNSMIEMSTGIITFEDFFQQSGISIRSASNDFSDLLQSTCTIEGQSSLNPGVWEVFVDSMLFYYAQGWDSLYLIMDQYSNTLTNYAIDEYSKKLFKNANLFPGTYKSLFLKEGSDSRHLFLYFKAINWDWRYSKLFKTSHSADSVLKIRIKTMIKDNHQQNSQLFIDTTKFKVLDIFDPKNLNAIILDHPR